MNDCMCVEIMTRLGPYHQGVIRCAGGRGISLFAECIRRGDTVPMRGCRSSSSHYPKREQSQKDKDVCGDGCDYNKKPEDVDEEDVRSSWYPIGDGVVVTDNDTPNPILPPILQTPPSSLSSSPSPSSQDLRIVVNCDLYRKWGRSLSTSSSCCHKIVNSGTSTDSNTTKWPSTRRSVVLDHCSDLYQADCIALLLLLPDTKDTVSSTYSISTVSSSSTSSSSFHNNNVIVDGLDLPTTPILIVIPSTFPSTPALRTKLVSLVLRGTSVGGSGAGAGGGVGGQIRPSSPDTAICYNATNNNAPIHIKSLISNKHLGFGFMKDCVAITHITLSSLLNITHIGDSFLSGCILLELVNLAPLEHVVRLGSNFLRNCCVLEKLDVSPLSRVLRVGPGFLDGCTGLQSIDLSPMCGVVGSSNACFGRN